MKICEYCGKEHNGSFGSGRFCNKSCMCSFNASKGKGSHTNHKAWNRGLTKNTDIRVKINSEHLAKTIRRQFKEGLFNNPDSPFCKQYWTKERRKRASDQKKQLFKDHPECHPNRRVSGNRNKLTYPEQLTFDWLIKNHIDFIQNYHINNRFVDFYVPSKNLFIEIDGERWHPLNNASDKKKDDEAELLGYQTLRIRFPSMRVIDTLEKTFLKEDSNNFSNNSNR